MIVVGIYWWQGFLDNISSYKVVTEAIISTVVSNLDPVSFVAKQDSYKPKPKQHDITEV